MTNLLKKAATKLSSFEVFVDHELRLVRITAIGELFQADGEKIISTARSTAAEHGYVVLYDIRQSTATVPFSSWFHMPRNLSVFQNFQTKRVKAAVLASPDDKAVEGYKFYEIVTENLGISLRIFFDEDEAIKWLQTKGKD